MLKSSSLHCYTSQAMHDKNSKHKRSEMEMPAFRDSNIEVGHSDGDGDGDGLTEQDRTKSSRLRVATLGSRSAMPFSTTSLKNSSEMKNQYGCNFTSALKD